MEPAIFASASKQTSAARLNDVRWLSITDIAVIGIASLIRSILGRSRSRLRECRCKRGMCNRNFSRAPPGPGS